MLSRALFGFLTLILLPHGCAGAGSPLAVELKYKATGKVPEVLAAYEAWFGHPQHIAIDYSSHDPAVISRQISDAKAMGISTFVVDWYGDREPFIDKSYGLVQSIAARSKFHVAMMYDETDQEDGATDEAIADFRMFHDTYLGTKAEGHEAYLTYQGRPVIFIFPKGKHTDWQRVRQELNLWPSPPLLIQENLPGPDKDAFDGFYAWINPGPTGWTPDGNNWGSQYLREFYQTMLSKHSDKIIVGGAWAGFDDSRAHWSLNRRISRRCGQTFQDTSNLWKEYFPAEQPVPFVMIETWNDHEEGSAVEGGISNCAKANSTDTH